MKYHFENARMDDIGGISAIEHEYFENGVAYTEEFIKKWMIYNPSMFWVVKDEFGKVLAHTILVPVTEECYKRLHQNELHDMIEFKETDVLQDENSDYYYTASIAVAKEYQSKLTVVNTLLGGIIYYFSQHGNQIITTPITTAGLRITKSLGYRAINGIDGLETNYEIVIGKEQDDPIRKKYSRILKRIDHRKEE